MSSAHTQGLGRDITWKSYFRCPQLTPGLGRDILGKPPVRERLRRNKKNYNNELIFFHTIDAELLAYAQGQQADIGLEILKYTQHQKKTRIPDRASLFKAI